MTNLYFREDFIGLEKHYPIVDEYGEEKYYLDQGIIITKYKAEVSNKDGSLAMTVERTKTFASLAYLVSFVDGTKMEVKKERKSQIIAKVNDETLSLEGDFKNFNLDIINDKDQVIGSIQKESKNGNIYYDLSINDNSYEKMLVGLAICIANMLSTEAATAIIIGSSI